VLKPAEQAPLSSVRLCRTGRRSGLPEGVLTWYPARSNGRCGARRTRTSTSSPSRIHRDRQAVPALRGGFQRQAGLAGVRGEEPERVSTTPTGCAVDKAIFGRLQPGRGVLVEFPSAAARVDRRRVPHRTGQAYRRGAAGQSAGSASTLVALVDRVAHPRVVGSSSGPPPMARSHRGTRETVRWSWLFRRPTIVANSRRCRTGSRRSLRPGAGRADVR